ncbi:MAG: isoleucine--tRNA ligase [Candidatus Omnitrophota bacterium]
MGEKVNYKETLNLPKTSFSMKANLPQREPEILKKWQKSDVYAGIIKNRENAGKTFILHDGPPYANGHIHMGHVLNKILKDICVKYFTMKGYLSPFIPGWDCHGLPVEHQLFKELDIGKDDISQVEFRKKAYKYAMKYVDIQSDEFERLGVFGDWKNPYLTLTKDYEADILSALADLYEKGYIYKDLKPVNWCRSCETALAEAEVEYEDKTSPSIYVKFESEVKVGGKKTFFVIWTTTPWTLVANVAIAVHPEFMYSYVETGGEVWIMASDLAGSLMEKFQIKDYNVTAEHPGGKIAEEMKSARHPFIDRDSVIVRADYVTKEEGTGCVHTAPGHGQEDYLTGKKYGLPMVMPVDSKGKFMEEAGEFSGQDVFKANGGIIEKMKQDGTLILSEEVSHSYPHCWRCKQPIIFRATEQWFMSIDHENLRGIMIDIIDRDVEWIPGAGKERIGSMVNLRPDWCLSRQRYWGVPIPAFKCTKCGEVFTAAEVIRRVSDATRKEGADVWFEKDIDEFLPPGSACQKCGNKEFQKEDDILDVWFDSGVSHKAVLDAREELVFPSDLYLEGSDQHRGWFQAALITSAAIKGCAPYRKVLTHGFVVDGEGKKMSKSVGNVISPQDVMKKYGADILRLWVASSDYVVDIKLSQEILERLADGYRKIRNTFRYLLSNLYDFDPSKDAVNTEGLTEIDRWMLSRLYNLVSSANDSYDKWEFHKVYRAVYDFCVYEVSSFYLDVLKDILYILAPDSSRRRSVQTVIYKILYMLTHVMAPVIPFTAEEAWEHVPGKDKPQSIHMSDWPDTEEDMAGWEDKALDEKWAKILTMRDSVMKYLEVKRESKTIGSSLEAQVDLYTDNEELKSFIDQNVGLFAEVFKVSRVTVAEKSEEGMEGALEMPFKVGVKRAPGDKCARCWNFSKSVGENKDFPELCKRCYDIIMERSHNG